MTEQNTTVSHQRQEALDFLKCIFILLMIAFHLVYFSELHPTAKQVVYTFHMPAFLLISGYLMNIEKPLKAFAKTLLGFALPYLIMEAGYTVMASLLPIREHIDTLTIGVFLDKLCIHPLGPYWYLHSLIICGAVYYGVFRYLKASLITRMMVTVLILYLLAQYAGLLAVTTLVYFLIGAVIRQMGLRFTSIFRPSVLAGVALILLLLNAEHRHAAHLCGMISVYMAISIGLWCEQQTSGRVRQVALFLGRNTLLLFVFSPIFTILCKQMVPYLAFDPTGLLFLLLSLVVCTCGSLALGWILQKMHLSTWLFAKRKVLVMVD